MKELSEQEVVRREKLDEIKNQIEIKEVEYAYPNTDKALFANANMTIPVG